MLLRRLIEVHAKIASGKNNASDFSRQRAQIQAPFIIQLFKKKRAASTPQGRSWKRSFASPKNVFRRQSSPCTSITATKKHVRCIASGFYSSVMIDASGEPFEKNVEITKRVVDKAHPKASALKRARQTWRRRRRHKVDEGTPV